MFLKSNLARVGSGNVCGLGYHYIQELKFITSIEALSKDKFSLYKRMYFTLLYFETCILSLQDIRFVYTKVSHPSNCEVYF